MKKKMIWITIIIIVLIVIGSIVIYKEIASNNMERITYKFLKDKGYTSEYIDDVEIKHSFINKVLGYNEWRIFVEFENLEDVIFAFTYRNDEIIRQGVKNENYQLSKEEIQDYETRFESGMLKYSRDNNDNLSYKTFNLIEDNTKKLYKYFTYEDVNIYLVNAKELEVNIDNTNFTLSKYIEQTNQTFERDIESIINKLTLIESLKDGGTQIYRNEEITLIKCNKIKDLDYNKDIYIGNKDLNILESYCE